jgi:hypothetical protein
MREEKTNTRERERVKVSQCHVMKWRTFFSHGIPEYIVCGWSPAIAAAGQRMYKKYISIFNNYAKRV